ncbi:SGNH/GDSL hydrolase family protein [Amphibacillus sp. Q70]|uniref:SGNH/GDSL hydrolase family protein n=1 Tax=Amphibacillus sp. Q70 TaxID=3453416 RepID=UPI003F83ECBB
MSSKRIVFIGDSITEWGRFEDADNIGENYVRIIRDTLAIEAPNQFPEIINRGLGGNRITDLFARWQADVIDLNPDIISISIGVNDVWRQLDHPDLEQVYPDQYEHLFIHLIEKTQAETSAEIILMEPTIIGENPQSEGNQKLIAYVDVVNQLAEQYQLTVVPTHQVFLNYLNSAKPLPLTIDSVHMSSTGNALMARAWLNTVYRK